MVNKVGRRFCVTRVQLLCCLVFHLIVCSIILHLESRPQAFFPQTYLPNEMNFLQSYRRQWRLTLFGRSVLLLGAEVLVNAACWTTAGILFGRSKDKQPVLTISLLAWVSGRF